MQGLWLMAFLVQWCLVLVLAVLVVGILRYLSSVQERWNLAIPAISKYELHQQIDDFELPDRSGTVVKGYDLVRSSGAVILFVVVGCHSCSTLLAQVSELAARDNGVLTKSIIIIVLGDPDKAKQLFSSYPGLTHDRVRILLDKKGITGSQFRIHSFPTGLAVDGKGNLVHQTPNPHVEDWLYTYTELAPPEKPVAQGWQAIITPAAYRG